MAVQLGEQVPVSTDLSITQALREMVSELHLTPETTLAAPITGPHDNPVIPEGDLGKFNAGQLFTVYNETGDEPFPIAQDWDGTNPVRIDWHVAGPGAAWSQPYPQGQKAGTNLFQFVPNNIDDMLWGEAPLCYIVITDEQFVMKSGHLVFPMYVVHLEYRRALVEPRPEGASPAVWNTNLWTRQQQVRCRLDMERIADMIINNPKLQTDSIGDNALDIGDPQNSLGIRFRKTWNKIIIDQNTQHFAALADFTVVGFQRVFYSKSLFR